MPLGSWSAVHSLLSSQSLVRGGLGAHLGPVIYDESSRARGTHSVGAVGSIVAGGREQAVSSV